MWFELRSAFRRFRLISLALICCAALPAAVLRYALEMPARVESGDEWQPWLFTGYLLLDLLALAFLLRFRHLPAAWIVAAVSGLAPFISIYLAIS